MIAVSTKGVKEIKTVKFVCWNKNAELSNFRNKNRIAEDIGEIVKTKRTLFPEFRAIQLKGGPSWMPGGL